MAFNLNKNDENNSKDDLTKDGSKSNKFNLAKNESSSDVISENPKKSKTWVFVSVGAVLLIAGSIYFYTKDSTSPITSTNAIDKVQVQDSINLANNSAKNKTIKDTVVANNSGIAASDNGSKGTKIIKNQVNSKSGNASADKIPKEAIDKKVSASFEKASFIPLHIDKDLVSKIESYLEQNEAASININGYASSEGNILINQALSQKRADVYKVLLVKRGIASNRLTAVGKGIDNPVATNDTKAGRNKNRRVEVGFL